MIKIHRVLSCITAFLLVGLLILVFQPAGRVSHSPHESTRSLSAVQMGGLPLSKPDHGPNNLPTVLIVINAGTKSYSTRLRDIRATWLKRVQEKPSMHTIFVGGRITEGSPDMFASICPEDFWEDSCKKANMAMIAHDFLNSLGRPHKFDWIYFADDDVYIFPDNLQRMIMSLGPGAKDKDEVWAQLGCFKEPACGGICGGGGYLFNAHVLKRVIEESDTSKYPSLIEETRSVDGACGKNGDLAIARLLEDTRKIKLNDRVEGMLVWKLKTGDEGMFEVMKNKQHPPYLFHYPAKNRLPYIQEKSDEFGSNVKLD